VNILALDLATTTGWAALVDGRVESGTHEFVKKHSESPGMRFLRFTSWIGELLVLTKPQVVIFEQPLIGAMKNAHVAELAFGFMTRVQEACAVRNIEYGYVHNAALKKWATGKGNAKKPEMIERAQSLYPGS